jgi:hypothetical protein
MFVAESKFRSDPAACIPHIQTPNPQALLDLITKPAVEAALLVRLARKAAMYGQDVDANGHPVIAAGAASLKVDVDEVVRLYRDYIIPLTKDVEVRWRVSLYRSARSSRRIGRLPFASSRWALRSGDRGAEANRVHVNYVQVNTVKSVLPSPRIKPSRCQRASAP